MKTFSSVLFFGLACLAMSCQYFDEKDSIRVVTSNVSYYMTSNKTSSTDNFSSRDIFTFTIHKVEPKGDRLDTTAVTKGGSIGIKGSPLVINKMRFISSNVGRHTIYGKINGKVIDSIDINIIARENPDKTPNYILLEQFIEKSPRYIRSFYNSNLVKGHIKNLIPIRYYPINDNPWYTDQAKQAEKWINKGTAISDEWKGIYMRDGAWNLDYDAIISHVTKSYNPFEIKMNSSVSKEGVGTVSYEVAVKLSIAVPVKIEMLLTHRPEKYTQQNIPSDSLMQAYFGNVEKVTVNPEYVFIKPFGNTCDAGGLRNCKLSYIDSKSRSVDTLSVRETSSNFVIKGQFQTEVASLIQKYGETLYAIMIVRDVPSPLRPVQDIHSIKVVKLGQSTQ